ncbi:MAG TPA: HDOD domain-containing protein [Candidatus Methylacidiphilales bacterium]
MTPVNSHDLVAPNRVKTEKSIFEYLEDPRATATLPSLQSVLNELEMLTQKSNIRLDEVTQLVEVDQGMSLRVLRMANSVYYSPSEPIMDLQDAILYIGLNSFRSAVASTRCIEKTCHIKQSVLDWRDFWTHAAGVGQITTELASHLKVRELPTESFYLMGLMHDIGKVVLAHVMPDEFNQIYHEAARTHASPAPLEMETLGIDHGHLGAWYLEKQGIPLTLREPVRFHHGPLTEDKPYIKHALLIRVADLLTLYYRLGESGNCLEIDDPFNSEEWKRYLKLCPPGIDAKELREKLIDRVARVSDLVHKIIV